MSTLTSTRSSPEFLFIDTQSSDTQSPTPPFNQIGQRGIFYQWTQELHSVFLDWWLGTEWVVQHASNTNDWSKKLNWESVSKKSSSWKQFYQGANRFTGEPVVICQQCEAKLSHPNTKGSGTTALRKHTSSSLCLKGSKSRNNKGGRQTQLNEWTPTVVSKTSIRISIKSNIY
jgi:hypothetical protein